MTPRLVHLSDLHLGFRAFAHTEQGANLREKDLTLAFRWALQETIQIRPDLVLITGDIFDHPDPPHTALLAFQRGIGLLRARLPGVRIFLIAGQRDTPSHPAELGPVAILDLYPGVDAAAATPRTLRYRDAGIHALLVPHRAAIQPPWPEIRPDPSAKWNLLLIRGMFDEDTGGIPIDIDEWSYIAVGGPHRPVSWAPHVRAAGALERPERDPWRSAGEERGFISYDLGTGAGEFHPVPGRPVVDLAPIRVAPGDPATGARRLRDLVEGLPGGIDGKIVRVRLTGDVITPADGVSEGLVAAIAERASHVEYLLSGGKDTTQGDLPKGAEDSASWVPEAVIVRGTAAKEGEEALPHAGVVLLTADTGDLRSRLARELHEGIPAPGTQALLRLTPPFPEVDLRSASALVVLGDPDPARLLRVAAELISPLRTAASLAGSPPPVDGVVMTETPREMMLRLEAEAIARRADWVEASGDLEAKMLEWVRERQDADSHLQGYRDRALELRARIRVLEAEGESSLCPTCGKPIGDHLPNLMETLRDEWEAVVQDGRWWKRRREQLDLKPIDLRQMEEEVRRLLATAEELGEGLEREKERERLLHSPDALARTEREGERVDGTDLPPLLSLPGVRDLLREAGNLLHRWTEGRIMGVAARESELRILGYSGEERTPEGSELAALRLSLRLVLSERVPRKSGRRTLLLWELHESGGEEIAASFLESVAEGVLGEPLILAVVPPSVLGRSREFHHFALEFRADERGRIRSRKVPGGLSKLNAERKR